VARCCEVDNEHSGSVQDGRCLDEPELYIAKRPAPYSLSTTPPTWRTCEKRDVCWALPLVGVSAVPPSAQKMEATGSSKSVIAYISHGVLLQQASVFADFVC